MVEDWLALPGDELRPDERALAEKADTTVPAVSDAALAVAKQRSDAQKAFVTAWRALQPRQKIYLRALQATGFNPGRALKILNEVPEELDRRDANSRARRISRQTTSRWARENDNFKLVLAALKAEVAQQVTSRDDLLLRAHRIAEQAEEGEPVFGADRDGGQKVIGHEKKLDTALRANEQLMKATKVLGSEQIAGGGGAGPALVIQVIQRDGALVDVTPRGVTIDLPGPLGP